MFIDEYHSIVFTQVNTMAICDRHCTSKFAITISIFHLGSYSQGRWGAAFIRGWH